MHVPPPAPTLNKHISIRKIKWKWNHHWNNPRLEENKPCNTTWAFTSCWMLTEAKGPCTFLRSSFLSSLGPTKQMLFISVLKVRNMSLRSWDQGSRVKVNTQKSLTQWHSCWVHCQQAFVDRRPLNWVGNSKFPFTPESSMKAMAVSGLVTRSKPATHLWLRKYRQTLMRRAHLTNWEEI